MTSTARAASAAAARMLSGLLVLLLALFGGASASAFVAVTAANGSSGYVYDASAIARVEAVAPGTSEADPVQLSDAREGSASPRVTAEGASTTPSPAVVATKAGSGNPHGLGVTDPPSRVAGPWTEDDLMRGAMGKPPKSLGSPELHHADQMPGAGIHEIDPVTHRLPGNHANKYNQGVTDAMRTSDRQLHWWYRAQEMGGRDVLGPEAFYD